MHKPIAAIAGAALALVIGTTTVAAVNPFQIDHAGAAVVGAMASTAGQAMSDMSGWARGWQMAPTVGPSTAPGMHTRATQMTQTHDGQTIGGSPRSTTDGQTTGGMGMSMGGPSGGSH